MIGFPSMFRICALVVALNLVLAIWPPAAAASLADFAGGVNNEYEYQELVFLSGEPVKFVGTVKISEKEKDTEKTIKYTFDLVPADSEIDGKFSRKMSYTITYDKRDDKSQTIADVELDTYKETISIGEQDFKLEDCQFSKSDVIDNQPASDYYNGTVTCRKYYTVNGDEGKLVVDLSGGTVGYENFWGSTDTQILNYYIKSYTGATSTGDDYNSIPDWEGSVDFEVSDSSTKSLRYEGNDASLSSFAGGWAKITEQGMFSRYVYDLPIISEGTVSSGRNRGSGELAADNMPLVERLIIPKFRDTSGHWAEDSINQLYSLDVYDEDTQFFAPDALATRKDFVVAVVKACNIRVEEEESTRSSRRKTEAEVSPFEDVSVDDPAFTYIKDAVAKGIVGGVTATRFMPDASMTRAEAITIIIRALGFENRAPNPGYSLSGVFADADQIPTWAYDSIYVGAEIGLLRGDSYGCVNPNQELSRAESATLLTSFLEFLRADLQQNYRDDILVY